MIGLLWYDSDPKTGLAEKIRQAADYYAEKYGKRPNVCLIHPKMINGETSNVDGIEIKASKSVMINHFLVGVG